MPFTHEDALAKQWAPAVRAMRPASQIMQAKAVARAITDDGRVDDAALLASITYDADYDTSSATASSSDTVNPEVYMSEVIHLTEGVWALKAMGGLTGRLSGSSNMNTYIQLNGTQSSNFQVPLAAGDTGVAWPKLALAAVSGDVTLQLLFRPSAGTLTIEAGFWQYKIRRLR